MSDNREQEEGGAVYDMIQAPLRAPHEDGMWQNEDLDRYTWPRHTELIEGQLIMAAAQRQWHFSVIIAVFNQLRAQFDKGDWIVASEMAVFIDKHNVPEPDVSVVSSQNDYDDDTTRYRAEDVVLAVEVESPATFRNDRGIKMELYAEAGIRGYLRIWREEGAVRLCYYRLRDGKYVTEAEGTGDGPFVIGGEWNVELDLRDV